MGCKWKHCFWNQRNFEYSIFFEKCSNFSAAGHSKSFFCFIAAQNQMEKNDLKWWKELLSIFVLGRPLGKIDSYNIIYGISMFLQKSTRQWLIIVILSISALGFLYQCNFLNLQKLFDDIKNCWNKIEEIFYMAL